MLRFSTIPIKRQDVASARAVETELLEVIFVRLGWIEAAAAMLAPKTASTFVQVDTLTKVYVTREII